MATDKVREHSNRALTAIDASLAEETTARHLVDELKREMREKLPSVPEIHNHVTIEAPERRDSSDPPSQRVRWSIPILGAIEGRGARAVGAVLAIFLVVGLVTLAWLVGRKGSLPPPMGSHEAPAAK